MDRQAILGWLRENDEARLAELWRTANRTRKMWVGDEVHLRGLIEFSNHCVRQCGYCGLRSGNKKIDRYRMTHEEILVCARKAVDFGYGTVVLQSGEDWGADTGWIEEIVTAIKRSTPLAVTLSLGERKPEELERWRRAGADRYLLRFETSNRALYDRIHPAPAGQVSDRHELLRILKRLGYQTGSGIMIGIPGQTYESVADDIELFRKLDLDMIGVGPYIAHPGTPLADERCAGDLQVPATESMTYKVIALARIVCPWANIPSTSALATLNIATGRELGLERGANVVMPNLTPPEYRILYEIYPAKACVRETAEQCHGCLKNRILSIGRKIGQGRGDCVGRRLKTAAGETSCTRAD